jgi:hypothetical protein
VQGYRFAQQSILVLSLFGDPAGPLEAATDERVFFL